MRTISVIMPIYNTDEFLEQSIQSVLGQSHHELELILINDNSDDKSKEIIEYFASKDSRVKTYHFNEQKGVGYSRNIGIAQSSGTYIYFLDSDDYLDMDTLKLLFENITDFNIVSGRQVKAHVSEVTNENDEDEREVELYREDKYHLINNNSVLNHLFRLTYIKENNFRFAESIERYSDLLFIIPVFLNAKEIPYIKECLYYKRWRNDPISNPALMQENMEGRIRDFTFIYDYLIKTYQDKKLHFFLDNQFIRLYKSAIVRYFKKNQNVDSVFSNLVSISKKIESQSLRKQTYMIRKEIKTLKRDNIYIFKKVNLRHHRLRKLKTSLKGRRRLYIQVYRSLFIRLPMKEKLVVFESFLGKSYSDSPKYIYEHILSEKMDYKCIWVFNERKNIPGDAIQVKRFSLRYFYYLARAKYWISNSRLPKTLNKREGNIYLQTWHGTPLKTLVFDMKDIYSADPTYKRTFFQQSRRWDYLSSPNDYSSRIFQRAFKYDKEMLEFGYPRNDILYQKDNKADILALKKEMSLPTDKKIILYAPTWRDDEFYSRGKYKFTLQLDLKRLQKHLGNEYIIVLRMHYFIASQLDITEYQGFAYDFSKYDDIAELYLVSDILITDYSSVFFDYANLKRPILFYTYDLEKYRDKLRGFYIDIESKVPGPFLMKTEEIIDSIKNIEEIKHKYKSLYGTFYEKYCKWDDGNAARKTVEAVFKNK